MLKNLIKLIGITMFKYYEKLIYLIYRLQLLKLKFFGAKIGNNIKVYGKFKVVEHPKRLIIEDNVTINEGVFINCRDIVHIKNNVRLSAKSNIITASLDTKKDKKYHIKNKIIIEENVWIAINSTILQGVTIGKNSIVAAHSLVTKNIEPNSIYAGIPAKKIATLDK